MSLINEVVKDYKSKKSINAVAKSMHISPQKIRKILLTAGVIQPEFTRQALYYLSNGLSKSEVAQKLEISLKVLQSYLPYTRMPYNQLTKSENAKKNRSLEKKKQTRCA